MEPREPVLLDSKVYMDDRGYFREIFRKDTYNLPTIVQWNVSESKKDVLRGLHYQVNPYAQAKIVHVLQGIIKDVVVDIKTGEHKEFILHKHNKLYVPKDYAHGFLALDKTNIVLYGVSNYYNPLAERTLLWNDPKLKIDWCINNPLISTKDKKGQRLEDLTLE